MEIKKLKLAVALLLLLAGMAACSNDEAEDKESKAEPEKEEFDPKPDPDAEQVSSYDDERVEEQAEMDKDLQAEYEEGDYSFDEPFVKVDPYDATPLTAVAMFETDEPAEITVTVGNGEDQEPVEKTMEGYETEHQIPILGLYPDADNTVKLEAKTEDGETETTEVTATTEALPDDFLTTELDEADSEKMEDGLTFIIPSEKYIFAVDDNADVRWYSTMPIRHVFKRLENGNVLFGTQAEEGDQYNELLEMDLLGKVSNAYHVDIEGYEDDNLLNNVVHHDVIELPNGNLLATTHEPDSDYIEDAMTEIDRETGETNQQLDVKDIFPEEAYEDYDGKNADKGDWFHQNTIWFDDTDDTILISGRSQDSIMKLSYPDMEIQWILAADEDWPEDYDKYLLDPDDDVKFPGGQHAVKTLPDQDDNPDTLDIMLFDNNDVITRGDEDVSGDYSRAVQYRINEKDNTVEEVWSYGEDRGKSFFSTIVGNTQYLNDTGNRLITSGYIEPEDDPDQRMSKVVEVDDQDEAEVLFEMTISGFEKGSSRQVYRGVRMPLYPEQKWDFTLESDE